MVTPSFRTRIWPGCSSSSRKPERKTVNMNSWIAVATHSFQHSQLTAVWLDIFFKSFLILIVATAVCLCWRRGTPSARHLLWFFAVAGLLCLPGLSRLLPSWQRPLWSVGTYAGSGNELTLTFELAPAKAATEPLGQQLAPSRAAET